MGRPRKQRRRGHGSAWHWKQTDCWYYTLPGTKKRIPLFDENDDHIRGRNNQEAAEHALASVRASGELNRDQISDQEWIVARDCSEYLQYCQRSVAAGSMSSHLNGSTAFLNDLCGYCRALLVAELKKSRARYTLSFPICATS
jgi:hypothetical protein